MSMYFRSFIYTMYILAYIHTERVYRYGLETRIAVIAFYRPSYVYVDTLRDISP